MKLVSGFFILLTILPGIAYSECYIIDDFKGYKVYSTTGAFGETTWSKSNLEVTFDGNNSGPKGGSSECKLVSDNTVLCTKQRTNGIAIEVWNVYPESGVLVMTRAANGLRTRIDGAGIFSGKIIGTCEK